jgi:hypothetical protein
MVPQIAPPRQHRPTLLEGTRDLRLGWVQHIAQGSIGRRFWYHLRPLKAQTRQGPDAAQAETRQHGRMGDPSGHRLPIQGSVAQEAVEHSTFLKTVWAGQSRQTLRSSICRRKSNKMACDLLACLRHEAPLVGPSPLMREQCVMRREIRSPQGVLEVAECKMR